MPLRIGTGINSGIFTSRIVSKPTLGDSLIQTVPMGGLELTVPWSVIVLVVELVTEFLVHAKLVYSVREDLEVKTAKVSTHLIYTTQFPFFLSFLLLI